MQQILSKSLKYPIKNPFFQIEEVSKGRKFVVRPQKSIEQTSILVGLGMQIRVQANFRSSEVCKYFHF